MSAVRYRSISAEFDVFRAKRRRRRALSTSPRRKSVLRSIDKQDQHSTSPQSHGVFLLSTKVPEVPYGAAILEPSSFSSANLYSKTNLANDFKRMPPSSIQEGILLSELLNGCTDLRYTGDLKLVKNRDSLLMSTGVDMDRFEFDSSDNDNFRTTAKYSTKFQNSTTPGTIASIYDIDRLNFSTGSNKNDSSMENLHDERLQITDEDIVSYTSERRFTFDRPQSVKKVSCSDYEDEGDEIHVEIDAHTSESKYIYTPYKVRYDDATDLTSQRKNRHFFSPEARSQSSISLRNIFQEGMVNTPISAARTPISVARTPIFAARTPISAARHTISRIEMDEQMVASPILVPPRQILLPYQGRMIVQS